MRPANLLNRFTEEEKRYDAKQGIALQEGVGQYTGVKKGTVDRGTSTALRANLDQSEANERDDPGKGDAT